MRKHSQVVDPKFIHKTKTQISCMLEMCRIGQKFLHISFILQKLCPIFSAKQCMHVLELKLNDMFGKHDIKEILITFGQG